MYRVHPDIEKFEHFRAPSPLLCLRRKGNGRPRDSFGTRYDSPVVLQSPLVQASVLAELRHVGAVVVREHLVVEDSVGHLHHMSPITGRMISTI